VSEIQLRTLVLNKNFMPHSVFPLSTINATKAIHGYFLGKNNIVHCYDRPILTPSRTDLYWPSVIVTRNAQKFISKVKMTDDTLYYREGGLCFWCDIPLTTKDKQTNSITQDHVVPKSKGGEAKWENIVASCAACNAMKRDALPIGRWKPKKRIFEPSFYQMMEIRARYPMVVDDESWIQFLPGFSSDKLIVQNHHDHHEHDNNNKPHLKLVVNN
jgi:5-methylcytosine-specific restriction endonuclease McrA